MSAPKRHFPVVRSLQRSHGMTIEIREAIDSRDRETFRRFPWTIHCDDPLWVPPLDGAVRRKLAPGHPFWKTNSIRLFIAYRDNQPVGTISVLRDRRHEEIRKEPVAFFGFFECVDDGAVAHALLAHAADVARSWGLSILRGPRNLSRVEAVGALVEGFSKPPPMMAGHSAPWYAARIEEAGFKAHHDVLAYDIDLVDESGRPRAVLDTLADAARRVRERSFVVRPCNRGRMGRDLDLAHRVFVEAFRDVPENTPMPRAQFVNLGRVIVMLASRHMLQLATKENRPAGFALCFPDIHEATIKARGQILPFGWVQLLAALPRIETASFKLIGVLPQYRKSGLHALMIEQAIKGCQNAGYRRLEASLIDARNHQSRRLVEGAGMQVYKRYRIFERSL